jgi:hypothetical protein
MQRAKSINQVLVETTASAGPVRRNGTIIEKKKGDWVWWLISVFLMYITVGSVYFPQAVPEFIKELFWIWVSTLS